MKYFLKKTPIMSSLSGEGQKDKEYISKAFVSDMITFPSLKARATRD